MRHRGQQTCFFLLLAAIAAFYFGTIRSGEGWTEDSALYVQHAKNISTGEPYGKVQFVYDAARWNVGPKAYPPGYPLILAAVYRWRGLDFRLMKMEIVAFFLLTLVVVFYAFAEGIEFYNRLAVVAIVAFNPLFWSYKEGILSDIPFLFFCYLALFLMDSPWFWEEKTKYTSLLRGALVGLAIYVAYATRVVGIVLLPTAIGLSLIRARKITRAIWVAFGTSLSMIVLQSLVIGDFGSYLSAAQSTEASPFSRVAGSVHYYIGVASILWDNGYSKIGRLVLFAVLTAFAVSGFVFQIRDRIRAWEIFACIYVPLLFIWEEDRYLFPLIPLYVFYFLKSAECLGGWKSQRLQGGLTVILMIVIAVSCAGEYSVLTLAGPLADEFDTAQAHQFFRFARENISDQDVIEFSAARTLSLYTGRHTFQYHSFTTVSDGQIWRDLQMVGVTYVTSTSSDEVLWTRFMKSNQSCLDEVFSNSQFELYRIRKAPVSGLETCGAAGP